MAATRSSSQAKPRTKRSSSTAHKTGSKTAHGHEHSENPSSTGHGKAKKEPAKQSSRCWPGYEPVVGKARGEKSSCEPKAHQTAAEKKSDAMASAASKLRKAGGNKVRANSSR